MRARRVFSQTGQGLRRNLTMTVAGVLIVTISMLLLSGALIIHEGTGKVKNSFLNQLNVSVYLDTDITTAQTASIESTLEHLPQVKGTPKYVSQAQACVLFKEYYADSPNLLKLTKCSELPPSLVVSLYNPTEFAVVQSAVGPPTPGVQSVADANTELKRVFTFLHVITLLALVIAIVALVATALLIYVAMQVSAFSRRRETGIMRLVGASDLSIQLPFILEGTAIGLTGGVVVAALLVPAYYFAKHNIATGVLRPFASFSIYGGAIPVVIIVAAALTALMSFITLQRHLRV